METHKFIFFFCAIIAEYGIANGKCDQHLNESSSNKSINSLFVFGDSYVDTGNSVMNFTSWKHPYGYTLNNTPSGRWSSGFVFTDWFAEFMNIKTPITYKQINSELPVSGMNFALGGTGVLDTVIQGKNQNMTTQIDNLENLIKKSVFSVSQLGSSVALVSVCGNDYRNARAKNMSDLEIMTSFVPTVVNQIRTNLERLYKMGIRKIGVTSLPPLGCFPMVSNSSKCAETINLFVRYHNVLLDAAVVELRMQHLSSSAFTVFDLHNAFMSLLNDTPHIPCCLANPGHRCSDTDAAGTKLYKLCSDPESTFFWDSLHPTHCAWAAVISKLQVDLRKFI